MITRVSRNFLISVLVSLSGSCASGFGARAPGLKLYSVESDDSVCPKDSKGVKAAWCAGKAGLYRPVDSEILSFSQARHFIAIDPEQFDLIIHACPH